MVQREPSLTFIGRIRSPFRERADCPRNIRVGDVEAVVEVDPPYREGLSGLSGISHVILLYWLHAADRSVLTVTVPTRGFPTGVFSTRAPVRPNPIGLAVVPVLRIAGDHLVVRGVDCLDGTPLIDIKPYLPAIDAVYDADPGWHDRR